MIVSRLFGMVLFALSLSVCIVRLIHVAANGDKLQTARGLRPRANAITVASGLSVQRPSVLRALHVGDDWALDSTQITLRRDGEPSASSPILRVRFEYARRQLRRSLVRFLEGLFRISRDLPRGFPSSATSVLGYTRGLTPGHATLVGQRSLYPLPLSQPVAAPLAPRVGLRTGEGRK
jgi:hypothetical protein